MDPRQKRSALRMLHHTVVIVAARAEGEIAAATITWLTQASFDPPLIMMSVKADSRLCETIRKAGTFAVNVLGMDQEAIANQFFRGATVQDSHINGHAFEAGEKSGAPLLLEAPAWFECAERHVFEGGDHTVIVAEVINAGLRANADADALLLASTPWKYGG